jgi:hypothetical protein
MRSWLSFFTGIGAWGASRRFIRLAVTCVTPVGLGAARFG